MKPRVLVASDTRLPSGLDVMHGLGRSAAEIAAGLHARGYDVSFYAHPDSVPPDGVELIPGDPEQEAVELISTLKRRSGDWEVVLDTGHKHLLSRRYRHVWKGKVINRVCDAEIADIPLSERRKLENKVVNSDFMMGMFPGAEVILTAPMRQSHLLEIARRRQFFTGYGSYILVMGEWWPHKRIDRALLMAKETGIPIGFAFKMKPTDVEDMIADAFFLYHRSSIDAAPRSIVECQLAGVPVMASAIDGSASYVINGVTGFVLDEGDDGFMEAYDMRNGALEPLDVSAAAAEMFNYDRMVSAYAELVDRAADGEVW